MAQQDSPGAAAAMPIAAAFLLIGFLSGSFLLALIPVYFLLVMANGIDQGEIDSR